MSCRAVVLASPDRRLVRRSAGVLGCGRRRASHGTTHAQAWLHGAKAQYWRCTDLKDGFKLDHVNLHDSAHTGCTAPQDLGDPGCGQRTDDLSLSSACSFVVIAAKHGFCATQQRNCKLTHQPSMCSTAALKDRVWPCASFWRLDETRGDMRYSAHHINKMAKHRGAQSTRAGKHHALSLTHIDQVLLLQVLELHVLLKARPMNGE